MPISYGDGGDAPPEKKKGVDRLEQVIARANEDLITGTVAVEEGSEGVELDIQPVDPQAEPLTAFSQLPVAGDEDTPDRIGHLVDLTTRDIAELTFEDEEGDDFTPG